MLLTELRCLCTTRVLGRLPDKVWPETGVDSGDRKSRLSTSTASEGCSQGPSAIHARLARSVRVVVTRGPEDEKAFLGLGCCGYGNVEPPVQADPVKALLTQQGTLLSESCEMGTALGRRP